MDIKNYADVKAFVATLTDEQLKEPVTIQVLDENSIHVTEMYVNEEDYFYNEDSEGLMLVSEYDPEDWEGKELGDEEYNTIILAGSRVFAYDDSFGEDDKVTHVIKPYQIIAAMEAIGFKTTDRSHEKLVFEMQGNKIIAHEHTQLSDIFEQLINIDHRIKAIEDAKNIQCSKGNFDVNEYMRGMANGLIFAEAVLKNIEPVYIEPKQ